MRETDQETAARLKAAGERADALRAEARGLLVDAVVRAKRAGMSQRAIASALGRSQPEVSRLLPTHFHLFIPRSRVGDKLAVHRDEIIRLAGKHGASNVRVFGSVARGEDTAESDVDLLVDIDSKTNLFDLSDLRVQLEELIGRDVDVIPDTTSKSAAMTAARKEAVPL